MDAICRTMPIKQTGQQFGKGKKNNTEVSCARMISLKVLKSNATFMAELYETVRLLIHTCSLQ